MLASKKAADPATVIEFVLDSGELSMSLQERKLVALKGELQRWLGNKGVTSGSHYFGARLQMFWWLVMQKIDYRLDQIRPWHLT